MIAGFIILRLRNILGRKTGHEPKIHPGFAEKKFNVPNNNVKEFKQNLDVLEGQEKKEFLKGAEIAYETILTSFAKGDTQKLKSLLTPDMATNFEQAIQVRNKENIKSEFTFIGVKESNVEKYEKIKNELEKKSFEASSHAEMECEIAREWRAADEERIGLTVC